MKKKSYLSYFGEILLIIILCVYFIKSHYTSYDAISILLLILIYLFMLANIYYTIKAKKQKEKMLVEILSYSIIWIILLISLICIKQSYGHSMGVRIMSFDAVIMIFALTLISSKYYILPITIIIMIIKYFRQFIKKK